jgi:hypothetical protein
MIAVVLILLFVGGCAVLPKADALAKVNEDIAALKAGVELDRSEVSAIKSQIGSIRVGGTGDTVTAWIYAAIAGAAIFYPAVIRPIRMVLDGKGKDNAK